MIASELGVPHNQSSPGRLCLKPSCQADAEPVPNAAYQVFPLPSPLPLYLSPGAYSRGPFPEVLGREEERATQSPVPTAPLDLSRDSPEQQGPASSATWPHQCLLIKYPNDNNNSSAGGSLRPSSGRPQVATRGDTPEGLSHLNGRGLKSVCSWALCQFSWVLWVGSRILS